jgi:hypothetical protein
MKALLDTHTFLWAISGDQRLSQRAAEVFAGPSDLWLSVASIWEILIKVQIGKMPLPVPTGPHCEEIGREPNRNPACQSRSRIEGRDSADASQRSLRPDTDIPESGGALSGGYGSDRVFASYPIEVGSSSFAITVSR